MNLEIQDEMYSCTERGNTVSYTHLDVYKRQIQYRKCNSPTKPAAVACIGVADVICIVTSLSLIHI